MVSKSRLQPPTKFASQCTYPAMQERWQKAYKQFQLAVSYRDDAV